MLIAVYGSLREGRYNHPYFLGDIERLDTMTVKGKLYSLGAYPAITDGEDDVEIELYDVPTELYHSIRGMEIGAGYIEIDTPTIHGEAKLWMIPAENLERAYEVPPSSDGIVRWEE